MVGGTAYLCDRDSLYLLVSMEICRTLDECYGLNICAHFPKYIETLTLSAAVFGDGPSKEGSN